MIDTTSTEYGTTITITFAFGDPVQNGSHGRVVIDIAPVGIASLTCSEGRTWSAPHGEASMGPMSTLEGAIEYARRHHPEQGDLIKAMSRLILERCEAYIKEDPKSPRAARAARRRARVLATCLG